MVQNVRGEPFRGSTNTQVAIIEYSDFNCSFCAKYATNLYPQLDRDYVRTGKVRYFFHDLPDRLDDDSLTKAQVARCAGEQGKFWEMHDRLFEDLAPLHKNPEAVERHALALGLDATKINACLQSGRYLAPIKRSSEDARRFGMTGTPSFLLGRMSESGEVVWGTKVILGAESYEALQAELEEFLAIPAK